MDSLIDMTPGDWTDWQAAFPADDADTQLLALRKYIVRAALDAHAHEPGKITAAWVNKKLPHLGISERIETESRYMVEAPARGILTLPVHARSRDEALQKFATAWGNHMMISEACVTGDPQIADGPEDPTGELPDDAPDTVGATLERLRETILLAVVAGPRICIDGANEFLARFGLERVPERRQFVVTRPATAKARTTVTAYDEASAQRVAEWRWGDAYSGYTVEIDDEAGDFTITGA
jgi:hypothetical protein